MNYLAFKNFEKTLNNQIKIKTNETTALKKISCSFTFKKLESFKNLKIIESLFFFRLISGRKSFISYLKKKYKSIDIIINLNINKKQSVNLMSLWIIFLFPIIKKKNLYLDNNFALKNNFMFKNSFYNLYPFFSNVYFSWDNATLNYLVYSNKCNQEINKLKNCYLNIDFKIKNKEIV